MVRDELLDERQCPANARASCDHEEMIAVRVGLHVNASVRTVDQHRDRGIRVFQGVFVKLRGKTTLMTDVEDELRLDTWFC